MRHITTIYFFPVDNRGSNAKRKMVPSFLTVRLEKERNNLIRPVKRDVFIEGGKEKDDQLHRENVFRDISQ